MNFFFSPSVFGDGQQAPIKNGFTLVPTSECPYILGIYDPYAGQLVLVSKEIREEFDAVPKYNEKGEPKILKGINGQQQPAREIRQIKTNQEIRIESVESLRLFIDRYVSDMIDSDKLYLDQVLLELAEEKKQRELAKLEHIKKAEAEAEAEMTTMPNPKA